MTTSKKTAAKKTTAAKKAPAKKAAEPKPEAPKAPAPTGKFQMIDRAQLQVGVTPKAPEAPAKREAPGLVVPQAVSPGSGMSSHRARDLNVMLKDLGLLERVDGMYSNYTRNAVSLLQQRLADSGHYKGAPHGNFDDATREALIADPSIPTA